MILARVVGTVVATRKDPRLEGKKLLIVKPISPEGNDEAGYVVAVDTPSFAVSDDTGVFTIHGVAPGAYTYHAWRAGAKQLSAQWTLSERLTIEWP